MNTLLLGDFRRIEQEAVEDLREKSRDVPKINHKTRLEKIKVELAEIFDVCKVKVPKSEFDSVCRHIINMIDDKVSELAPVKTEQTIVEALKKIGFKQLVEEYRKVSR